MKLLSSVIFALLVAAIVNACSNSSTNTSEENPDTLASTNGTDTTSSVPAAAKQCYSRMDKDTVVLQIIKSSDTVTGTLTVQIQGKDKNTGTLSGTMIGDTLVAEYIFMSEGTQSVRQVAFLRKNNMMVEGFGDVDEKGGKMVFKNTSRLKFDEKMALKEVPCDK